MFDYIYQQPTKILTILSCSDPNVGKCKQSHESWITDWLDSTHG